jgi:hypothetical protein
VPPAEVWLRVVLGDGIWLILAVAGGIGLWLLPGYLSGLFVPWALYTVATSVLFHVELRYRLPLYPVLALAAGMALLRRGTFPRGWRLAAGASTIVLLLALLLLHRPYLAEGGMLTAKHWHLWSGDGTAALRNDPTSALARVTLARNQLRMCEPRSRGCEQAEHLLHEAIDYKAEHPYAHLLLGALLRERGDADAARAELQYETRSLEDLQAWMVNSYGPRRLQRVDVGNGLDLGEIEGFHAASDGHRWTGERGVVWVGVAQVGSRLRLRLSSGRPEGYVPVPALLKLGGQPVGELAVGADWQTYEVSLPATPAARNEHTATKAVPLAIEAPTFRPRDLDRRSDDSRRLGVKVDWVEVVGE